MKIPIFIEFPSVCKFLNGGARLLQAAHQMSRTSLEIAHLLDTATELIIRFFNREFKVENKRLKENSENLEKKIPKVWKTQGISCNFNDENLFQDLLNVPRAKLENLAENLM